MKCSGTILWADGPNCRNKGTIFEEGQYWCKDCAPSALREKQRKIIEKESQKALVIQKRKEKFKELLKSRGITIKRKTIYVTVFRCECGREIEYYGHGGKKPKETDYPSSGEWNGWIIKPKAICPICRFL